MRRAHAQKARTYLIRSPQCLGAALRQPDILELALLNEPREGLHRFLDRDLRIDACALEEIELFEASQVGDDVVHAPAQILRAGEAMMSGHG